jgi:hypothetical protein
VAALFQNLEDGVSLSEFVELFPGEAQSGDQVATLALLLSMAEER